MHKFKCENQEMIYCGFLRAAPPHTHLRFSASPTQLLVGQLTRLPFHSGYATDTKPRQQKFRAMNGAHLASPIRGELGYAHWPQLGTQFVALLGTKFGAH